MSEFSGKCDVWDSLYEIRGLNDDSDWSKVTIVQDGKVLDINSLKDLIKYAPYLIRSGYYSKEESYSDITTESFIDSEEKERLEWRLKDARRAYRCCKRKKREFIPEEIVKEIFWHPDELDLEVCRRVKEHPYATNMDGLHTKIHDYYREVWYLAMLEYGYTPKEAREWIYGDNY